MSMITNEDAAALLSRSTVAGERRAHIMQTVTAKLSEEFGTETPAAHMDDDDVTTLVLVGIGDAMNDIADALQQIAASTHQR